MVDEGFGFARALWDGEGMCEKFFDEKQMWGGSEGGVEGEDGPRTAETIARKVELGHCVYCECISDYMQ